MWHKMMQSMLKANNVEKKESDASVHRVKNDVKM